MRCEYSQDRNDGLAVPPSHLLNVPNSRDQVTSTARAHKQPIPLNEEPSHTDRLGVRYPTTQGNNEKNHQRQSFSHLVSIPGPGVG